MLWTIEIPTRPTRAKEVWGYEDSINLQHVSSLPLAQSFLPSHFQSSGTQTKGAQGNS